MKTIIILASVFINNFSTLNAQDISPEDFFCGTELIGKSSFSAVQFKDRIADRAICIETLGEDGLKLLQTNYNSNPQNIKNYQICQTINKSFNQPAGYISCLNDLKNKLKNYETINLNAISACEIFIDPNLRKINNTSDGAGNNTYQLKKYDKIAKNTIVETIEDKEVHLNFKADPAITLTCINLLYNHRFSNVNEIYSIMNKTLIGPSYNGTSIAVASVLENENADKDGYDKYLDLVIANLRNKNEEINLLGLSIQEKREKIKEMLKIKK